MGSLSTVYTEHVGPVQSPERLYLGFGAFITGSILLLVGILTATTQYPETVFGLQTWQAWKMAGIVAGLGTPILLSGLFIVLPTSREQKYRVGAGVLISLLGVLLFYMAFPYHWHGDRIDHTARVAIIYFIGIGITFFYTFITIATFKVRNNPGGTVAMPETPTEQRPESSPETPSTGRTVGASTVSMSSMDTSESYDTGDGEILDQSQAKSNPRHPNADRYCGNCRYFRYVDGESGKLPYCGFHDEQMPDLEPCDDWQSNTTGR